MVQSVYAEGKREVSSAQSWKFQIPASFACGFPADMKLCVRYLGYFVCFFHTALPERTKNCSDKIPDSLSISFPFKLILLILRNPYDDYKS